MKEAMIKLLEAAKGIAQEPIPLPDATEWECNWCASKASTRDSIYHLETCPILRLREALPQITEEVWMR